MKCPKCGQNDDKVIDSRLAIDESSVKRRRECLKCGYRFTTVEEVIPEEIKVIKRNGEREDFDRSKVRTGIVNACYKRPVSSDDIDRIVDSITRQILGECQPEVASARIGDLVMEHLKKLDQVAYVRFASVYRQLQDVREFATEVRGRKK
ncbi:MAG: transcriptional regulator NrdR [Victivallaceae bacterium]|nr:transcriptional regulator NrdR [Victivallaceae bacterium]